MISINVSGKYQRPPQPPPVFDYTIDSVQALAKSIISKKRSLFDKISATVTPETATFENVVEAIAREYDYASISTTMIYFYPKVASDPDLREACRRAEDEVDEYDIESSMREDIFKLVDVLHEKRDSLGLGREDLRLVKRMHKAYISDGLGLPAGPVRTRFTEIRKRLGTLQAEYRKNLSEENGCVWLTRVELEGVPHDVVSTLQEGVDCSSSSSTTERKLRLTFKYPYLRPTLQYAADPDVRKRVWMANQNKVRYYNILLAADYFGWLS
jgi:metallopeptidase MepB